MCYKVVAPPNEAIYKCLPGLSGTPGADPENSERGGRVCGVLGLVESSRDKKAVYDRVS